ncbi:hypothetical protein SAMN05518855_1016133 [Paenibacillus sp. CF384]|nr:hypothetical protein SAMN05518855_1016133 [Paenibacillus sp. CF384]
MQKNSEWSRSHLWRLKAESRIFALSESREGLDWLVWGLRVGFRDSQHLWIG